MQTKNHRGKWTLLQRSILAIIVSASVAVSSVLAVENEDNDSIYLSEWLSKPELVFDGVHVPTTTLRSYYAARNYRPVWVDTNGLTDRAKAALAQIETAGEDGLNPALYAVGTIHRIAEITDGDAERRSQVRLSLEMMMSNAVLHYATDMRGGVANPQWDTGRQPLGSAEQFALLKNTADSENAAGYLKALAPQSSDYTALKTGLQQYQKIAANGGWPSFTVGKNIKPGGNDPRIASVRQILRATGDLQANTEAPPVSVTYDSALVDAVKHFQARHSIEANGVLNAATQQALAVPVRKRIEQLAITLERMRWMPHDLGNRYVLVNVPAYQLRAVSGNQQLTMKVIVGKPSTQTPMFSKEITNVVFNPSWGVPAKIAMNEMLPKIQEDPNYLVNAGYTLTENGQEVDPNAVDWSVVGNGYFPYAIRQNPGDGNALGKVKFFIPDSDNVYLHDTAQRKLFARTERSLSHGCVRLNDPASLTKFVLEAEGWSAKKIATAYDSDVSRTVAVTPLPVHLVYWTSWVDAQGNTHFQRDIYGKDKKLLAVMNNPIREERVKLAMN